jgi:hypothetical protein
VPSTHFTPNPWRGYSNVLSHADLSKINDAMNKEFRFWKDRARLAKDDVDEWNQFISMVMFRLSSQLSTTSNRNLFSRFTSFTPTNYPGFMEMLKGDQLKKWNDGVYWA